MFLKRELDRTLKNIVSVSLLFLIIVLSGCGDAKTPDDTTRSHDTLIVSFTAVGDLMCHAPNFKAASVAPDSFDFSPMYAEVKDLLSSADFTFGNLETVLDYRGGKYIGFPLFNSPMDYARALKENGFDAIATVNNHSIDRGEKGILRTIDILNQYNLPSFGTYTSQKDRDSIRVFMINGLRVAVVGFTYSTNGNPVPKGKDWLVNRITEPLIAADLKKAASLNPDLVLCYFHFGEEYQKEPNAYQRNTVNFAIKHGADIIIASHPHVMQPVEFFKPVSGRIDSGFVAYSLGNFLSNQQWRYSDAGVILNFSVEKTDSLRLRDVSFVPTFCYKGVIDGKLTYRILPSEMYGDVEMYPFVSATDRVKIEESLHDTRQIMTQYSNRIRWEQLGK